MKLTGKLKENVEKAENKEQAKKPFAKAGIILSDAELDQVSGGDVPSAGGKPRVFQDSINISGEYESPL